MSRSAQARGRWAEDLAADHYRRAGYRILSRNWRSPVRARPGELDLVVTDGDTVVFCEVKARRDDDHGTAGWKVDRRKQTQVRAVAELWLIEHRPQLGDDVGIRFDVVTVDGNAVTPIEAAF